MGAEGKNLSYIEPSTARSDLFGTDDLPHWANGPANMASWLTDGFLKSSKKSNSGRNPTNWFNPRVFGKMPKPGIQTLPVPICFGGTICTQRLTIL